MFVSLLVLFLLVIAFLLSFWHLVGVMIISVLLPIDLYKSLWNSENG